ncbi:MAG: rhomboid family intramembrane serine protease, partial [Verrucomicrobiota bacterium]
NAGLFLLQNFGVAYDFKGRAPMGGLEWKSLMDGEVWRLVSYGFVHANFSHLAMNMLFLIYFCGGVVAEKVGSWHFAVLYLLGGIVGGLANIYVDRAGYLVGASSGGFAMLCALATLDPDRLLIEAGFFRLRIVSIARALVILAGFLFCFEWFRAPEAGGASVGHLAHLGGALVGWSYMHLLGRAGVPFSARDLRREREKANLASTPKIEGFPKKEEGPNVDAILDKISASGMESLSAKERKILDRASGGS